MIRVVGDHAAMYFHKPYCHETEADAFAQVEAMMESRMKSLLKEKAELDRKMRDTSAIPVNPLIP